MIGLWGEKILVPYNGFVTLLLISLFVFSFELKSEEIYEPFVPVRPMGMGGAFTAVANDHNSVWTNPAGIGRIRKARSRQSKHMLTLPALVLGANTEGQNFYHKVEYLAGKDSGTTAEAILNAIKATPHINEKPLWGRVSMNPQIFFEPNTNAPMMASMYASSTFKLVFLGDETKRAQTQTVLDFGAIFGMGITNEVNRTSFGIQFRPVYRFAYDDKMAISLLTDKKDLEKKIKQDANSGVGLGVDIGFLATFADFWFPSLGVAILNLPIGCQQEYLNPFMKVRQEICGTKYSGKINNPESPFLIDPMDMRIGVAITPRLTRSTALRFAIDMHNLYFNSGTTYYGLPGIDPIKQFHAGAELLFGSPILVNNFSIRAGFSQGFTTMGLTVRLGGMSFEFANYSKDISSEATPVKDNRTLFSFTAEI